MEREISITEKRILLVARALELKLLGDAKASQLVVAKEEKMSWVCMRALLDARALFRATTTHKTWKIDPSSVWTQTRKPDVTLVSRVTCNYVIIEASRVSN